MEHLKRKAIYCPKKEEHAHPKILLLLEGSKLTVRCHEHEWIDVELIQGGELINFDNISVRLTDVRKGTHFDLEELPTISSGQFKTKKKRSYANN